MRIAGILNRIVTVLTITSLIVPPALAQDIVGAGTNGPQVLTTANGTPLIMIQTPNANGVSHNTFSQFDVGTSGVILNNVNSNYGLTNLAGYVQGNANLSGGAATLIINEVTSANPSSLSGYIEVGGAAANVVVANPWGITCNGCGFINTPRAVLTTGTPTLSGGNLQGFSVEGGTIAIGELGLDARGVSQFDLIARKVTFGGSVHGQRIRVIAGRNDVLFATSEATAKAPDGSAGEFAIDSTVLGGMYAGAISILSTEQGAGVRAPAKMSANAGEMMITTDGRLVIGQAAGTGAVTARGTDITVEKSIWSKGALSVNALHDLVLEADASIVTEASASLSAGRDLTLWQGSTVHSETAATLTAPGRFTAQSGARVMSFGSVSVNGGSASFGPGSLFYAGLAPEGGTARVADLTLNLSGAATADSATFFATGRAVFDADAITLDASAGLDPSRFVALGSASLTADVFTLGRTTVEAGSDLSIEAAERIATSSGTRLYSSRALRLSAAEMALAGGLIAAAEAVTIAAQELTQGAGNTIAAGGAVAVTSDLATMQGKVQGNGVTLTLTQDATLSGEIQSTAGLAVLGRNLVLSGTNTSNGNMTVTASGNLTLSGQSQAGNDLIASAAGTLTSNATLGANGRLQLSAASLAQSGNLVGIGGINLTSDNGLTTAGSLKSGGDLVLAAGTTLTNDAGLLSGGAIRLGASGVLVNTGSGLARSGADALALTMTGSSVQNSGSFEIAGNITFSAASADMTNSGVLTSGGNLHFAAAGNTTNSAALVSLASLTITSGSDLSNTAALRAGAGLSLNAGDGLINSGNLIATGDLRLTAGSDLTNSGGFLSSGGLFLTAGDSLVQSGSGLSATGASASGMTLTAARVEQSGSARIADAVNLTASQGDLTNSGILIASGAMTLSAATSLTNEAALSSGGNVALNAASVTSSGVVTAVGTLSATATDGDLTLEADTASRGDQILSATNALTLSASHRSVEGDLTLTAGGAYLPGDLIGQRVSANLTGPLIVSGNLVSLSTVDLRAGSIDLGGDANIVSLGALRLTATDGGVSLAGDLQSNAALTITSAFGIVQTTTSVLTALAGTTMSAGDQISLAGIVQGNGTISLTTPSAVTLESTSKLISTQGDILIAAGGMDVVEQTLGAELGGDLTAARHITVSASRINHSGNLTAGGLTRLSSTTGGIDLGGDMSSGGFRLISAEGISVGGQLRGAVQADAVDGFANFGDIDADLFALNAASFTNNAGTTLTVDGDAVVTLTGDATIRGEVTTAGLLSIQSGGLIDADGLVDAGTSLSLRGVDLDNRGILEGQTVSANFATITNSGTIHSLDDATLISSASFFNSGTVKAKDDLTISADQFFNQSQIEAETGVLSIRGKTILDNNPGSIAAGTGILLATDQDLVVWSSGGGSAIGNFASGGWLNIQGADGGAAGAVTVRAGEELVAKGDLVIHAASFNNAGTIASASGNLVLRGPGNQTNTGLLYAGGEWLMLRSDAAVLNDGGTILAAENLVICGNGTTNCLPNLSTDRSASLTNKNGGRIETFAGDLVLAADEIAIVREVTLTSTPPIVSENRITTEHECYSWLGCTDGHELFNIQKTTTTTQSLVVDQANSQLVSGKDIYFDGTTVTNSHGHISAQEDISINAANLNNLGVVANNSVTRETSYFKRTWHFLGCCTTTLLSTDGPQTTLTPTGSAFGTIEAGGNITGTITGTVTNQSVNANALTLTATPGTAPTVAAAELSPLSLSASVFGAIVAPDAVNLVAIAASNPNGPASISATTVGAPILTPAPTNLADLAFNDGPAQTNPGASTNPGSTTVTPGSVTTGINLGALGNDQLFVINSTSATSPLIESRHQFIDLSAFISSDYFLGSLNFDPEITQRRLGDALVETWLVRDQLTKLTGGRILNPGMSEREQMRAMYDNAIGAANSLNLRPGVALSPTQIAGLTDNIIWMEERVVSGQRVLVPQVYLAAATVGQGPTTGARISGTTIAMNVGNLNNSGGTIAAQDNLVIQAAGDITNRFGQLSAGAGNNATTGAISLSALNGTFSNLSGIITAGSIAISALDASIATDKLSFGTGGNITDIAGNTASIIASGDLVLNIVNDLTITGANLQAGQNLILYAGNDIKLDALDLTHQAKFQDGRSINEFDLRTAQITTLTALTGNLSVVSAEFSDAGAITGGGDITTNGAALNAAGRLSVQAAMGGVQLGATTESDYAMHYSSGGGWLVSHENRAESFDLTHVETALTGSQVNVFAAGALLSEGGLVTSTSGDLALTGGAVVLLATTDLHASYNHSSSSILGGLFDFSSTTQDLRSLANVTKAKSAEDLFIDSATTLTLQGTELEAARNVSIKAAESTTLLGAVNTTFNSTVTHHNNGFLVTDTTSVNVVQTASFPRVTAGGATDFDPGTMATLSLDAYQASLGTSPLSLIGIGEAGTLDIRLAVMTQTLFPKKPTDADKQAAGEKTEEPGYSANPAYNFAGSKIDIGRPTAADGAEFAYLDRLFDQGQLTVEEMALVQHEFYKQDTQLGVLGKLLVQFVTGFAMANVGALSSLGGVQQAMASSVISGSLEGAVTGNFDLGKIIGNAVFAGVSGFVGQNLNLGQSLGLSTDNLLGLSKGTLSVSSIADKFGHSLINAGLTTAVYGGDFGTNFASAFKSSVVNMLQADLQQIIGSRYNDENGKPINGGEGSAGHVTEHTVLGCLMGEALGSGCQAGAMAAAGQAIYAGMVDPERALRDSQTYLANAELIGGLAASLVTGGDVNATMIASGIARSGFENNYLFHEEAVARASALAELQHCEKSGNCTEKELAALRFEIDRLNAIDELRDAILLSACSQGASSQCLSARAELFEAAASYQNAGNRFESAKDYERYIGGSTGLAALRDEYEQITHLNFETERLASNATGIAWDPAAFGKGVLAGINIGIAVNAAPAMIACLQNPICAIELTAAIGDDVAMAGGAISATVVGGKVVLKTGQDVIGELDTATLTVIRNADGPYDPRAVRAQLEEIYGQASVISTTVPPLRLPNVRLAGQEYKLKSANNVTVVFDNRGFPIFDDIAKFDTRINISGLSYESQMRAATRDLRAAITANPSLANGFSSAQLSAIQAGEKKIPGLTWHHHQDTGRMQLVNEDIHAEVSHAGQAMWDGQ